MRLLVTTPMSIVVDAPDVRHIRAEDETGAFGILPRHADFITVLTISIVTWTDGKGMEHHVAVRGGILTVTEGRLVEIATRDAIGDDTLSRLGAAVLDRFRNEAAAEEQSRIAETRLHLAAIRHLQNYVRFGHGAAAPQAPQDASAIQSSGFEE